MSQKFYAIKCSNCAAPLDILGGGRVQTVTCAYCHSTLDLNDEYKVLAKFNDIKRPLGPFEIGMRGNIKGVEWTIIGWISYKTVEFPSEEWSEFFLYSPTHGYAWLVYENSKVYFSKRVRDFDLLQWQEKKPKTTFYHKGHYIRQEASYVTYVDYVEGELNYIAKFGDKITCWDYNGVRHQSLSIEKSSGELEVYHTEKLNKKDIYTAFSLEYKESKSAKKTSLYDDITIEEEETHTALSFSNIHIYPFIILLILAISSLFYSQTIFEKSYTKSFETQINVNSNAFLTAISLKVQGSRTVNNKLSLYQNGKKIFYIDKDIVYFIKKDLGNSWYRGDNAATIYLKLDKGEYRLLCQKENPQITSTLSIKQEVIRLKYIIPLLVLFITIFILSNMHLINANISMIVFILIAVIVAFEIFGPIGLFFLGFFYFFIKNAKNNYDENGSWIDDNSDRSDR
ncbi:MAG: DUF4178 domain-containing protein [Campylobacterota bacterium]|nr:DUF4178 domain-containing protein [Campylobacterota bacterium]